MRVVPELMEVYPPRMRLGQAHEHRFALTRIRFPRTNFAIRGSNPFGNYNRCQRPVPHDRRQGRRTHRPLPMHSSPRISMFRTICRITFSLHSYSATRNAAKASGQGVTKVPSRGGIKPLPGANTVIRNRKAAAKGARIAFLSQHRGPPRTKQIYATRCREAASSQFQARYVARRSSPV